MATASAAEGAGEQRQVSSNPMDFASMILYVKKGVPACDRLLQLASRVNDVIIQEVDNIQGPRPAWLRGVPTLVELPSFKLKTGTEALKAMEGAARFITNELRGALTGGLGATVGAVLARPALRKFRDRMNPTPPAPPLGLNGILLKCHCGATDRDFTQAIQVAADLARSDFAGEIERNLRRLPAALAVQPPAAAAVTEAGPAASREPT